MARYTTPSLLKGPAVGGPWSEGRGRGDVPREGSVPRSVGRRIAVPRSEGREGAVPWSVKRGRAVPLRDSTSSRDTGPGLNASTSCT